MYWLWFVVAFLLVSVVALNETARFSWTIDNIIARSQESGLGFRGFRLRQLHSTHVNFRFKPVSVLKWFSSKRGFLRDICNSRFICNPTQSYVCSPRRSGL